MVDLHLRLATSQDLPLVAIMNRQLIEDEVSENTMTLEQLEVRLHGFMDRGWKIVIAEYELVPIGYATFFIGTDELDERSPRIQIGHYFVRRERRNVGVGTEFLRLLELDWFPNKAKIVLDVLVINTSAQTFYRSLGFVPYSMLMEKG
jgi:GNAT superfamily N-acetyltransferase